MNRVGRLQGYFANKPKEGMLAEFSRPGIAGCGSRGCFTLYAIVRALMATALLLGTLGISEAEVEELSTAPARPSAQPAPSPPTEMALSNDDDAKCPVSDEGEMSGPRVRMRNAWEPFRAPSDIAPIPISASWSDCLGYGQNPPYFIGLGYSARAAAVYDSARLNPNAGGMFLPSAIPAKGDLYFGAGNRATVLGTGSSLSGTVASSPAPTYDGVPDASQFEGIVTTRLGTGPDGNNMGVISDAYVTWNNFTFGLTQTTFTDPEAYPDMLDLGGPNAYVSIGNGIKFSQGLIRYAIVPRGLVDPGLLGNFAIEMPGADVTLPPPIGVPATGASVQHYESFSRYPDLVLSMNYRDGEAISGPCGAGGKKTEFDEWWHVQMGAVVRDIGVDEDGYTGTPGYGPVRTEACGWGLQLSGRFELARDCCGNLSDSVSCAGTYGQGVAHYFNDLHDVGLTPGNDAIYDRATKAVTPLPVTAYFMAYTHQWNLDDSRNPVVSGALPSGTLSGWRSTVVYSRINLDSRGLAPNALFYHVGDEVAINLLKETSAYGPVKPPTYSDDLPTCAISHQIEWGAEYIYGQKENVGGGFGHDNRFEIVLMATK